MPRRPACSLVALATSLRGGSLAVLLTVLMGAVPDRRRAAPAGLSGGVLATRPSAANWSHGERNGRAAWPLRHRPGGVVRGDRRWLTDDDTHGPAQCSRRLNHAAYGAVQVDAWTELHVAGAPEAPFSVVRVRVERLAQKKLCHRDLSGWPGSAVHCQLRGRCGAGTCSPSRSNTPSAFSNRRSAGADAVGGPARRRAQITHCWLLDSTRG